MNGLELHNPTEILLYIASMAIGALAGVLAGGASRPAGQALKRGLKRLGRSRFGSDERIAEEPQHTASAQVD